MTDYPHDCDDHEPALSESVSSHTPLLVRLGEDNVVEIEAYSDLGGVGVESITQVEVLSATGQVGADNLPEIAAYSTLGVGPTGPQGPVGPQGPIGPQGPGVQIEVVAQDDWPPADPETNVLYLKGM